VRAIAEGRISRLFASAKPGGFVNIYRKSTGREFRTFMRTITEGLGLTSPAGAPVILLSSF